MGEQNNSPTLVRAKCFHTLDAYVRLITLLVKHSGESQTITKVNLLNKVSQNILVVSVFLLVLSSSWGKKLRKSRESKLKGPCKLVR